MDGYWLAGSPANGRKTSSNRLSAFDLIAASDSADVARRSIMALLDVF